MKKGKVIKKVFAWTGVTLGGIVALIVAGVCGVTWYLTPDRLTEIVNREASEYLNADVKASNVRFTFWSTFPRFMLATDSVRVDSRVFDSVPEEIKKQLPENARFLASAAGLKGGINLLQALRGRYLLRNVEIDSLRVNLVAYNDTLANYNILPSDGTTLKEVPYFSADSLRLTRSGYVSYFSVPTATVGSARLQTFRLVRLNKSETVKGEPGSKNKGEVRQKRRETDTYAATIEGEVTAESGRLRLFNNFPFGLGGDVSLRFHPFGIGFSRFGVNLGNVRGKMNLDLDFGEEAGVNNFKYHIDSFSLLGLLSYLPAEWMPDLKGIDGSIDVEATATLTSPYLFSSTSLPSLRLTFQMADGDVTYVAEDGKRYTVRHENLEGIFDFDGTNPEASHISIPPFILSGTGFTSTIAASACDLTTSPEITGEIEARIEPGKLSTLLPQLKRYGLAGSVEVNARGQMEMDTLSVAGIRQALAGMRYEMEIDSKHLSARMPVGKGERMKITLNDFEWKYGATGFSESDLLKTPLHIRAGSLIFSTSKDEGMLKDIDIDLKVDKLSSPRKVGESKNNYTQSREDSQVLSLGPHTPVSIIPSLKGKFAEILRQYDAKCRLRVGSGYYGTRRFPTYNNLKGLDMELTCDSVRLRKLSGMLQGNRMEISGVVSNLSNFLLSTSAEPIRLAMEIALDTVNINQLARAYARGRMLTKGDNAFAPPAPGLTTADTTTLLIPRNIEASINARVKETVYTNLHLYDLSTTLVTSDGLAQVKDLKIGSDFGHATLGLQYDTSDASDIDVTADVDIEEINVVNFFKKFHTLLLMMPQMKNLEGTVTAKMHGGMDVYPNMFVNVPSLGATLEMEGIGLTVHQNKFIRHITKMLLIRDDGPLHIRDMKVRASIHDNLIELYPFLFEFDRYRLRMLGTNNFDGELYYHIGVEKSPVPFEFGINISGEFGHPHIGFGRSKFDMKKAESVTSAISDEVNFNLVSECRKFIREFLRKAAESDTTSKFRY